MSCRVPWRPSGSRCRPGWMGLRISDSATDAALDNTNTDFLATDVHGRTRISQNDAETGRRRSSVSASIGVRPRVISLARCDVLILRYIACESRWHRDNPWPPKRRVCELPHCPSISQISDMRVTQESPNRLIVEELATGLRTAG